MSLIALERAIWNLKIKLEPAILFANGYWVMTPTY